MRALAEIVRLRTDECSVAADAIAQIARGDPDYSQSAGTHVSQCLRCQAEVAAYRRIMRHLRSMRTEGVMPPPGSLVAVLAALQAAAADPRRSSPRWAIRAACVGGITAATGAAGVLVWISRRRPGFADAG